VRPERHRRKLAEPPVQCGEDKRRTFEDAAGQEYVSVNQIITAAEASTAAPLPEAGDLLGGLRGLLGADHVLTAAEDTVFFSTDHFTHGIPAEAVIQPGTAEEVGQAVRLCIEQGRAVIPRGGGFSYTQGYIPVRQKSVTLDLRRLNKILEINTEDLWVAVEVGCTWADLYEALKAKGFRTPYFGPMSGYRATIGGALSQGSFFLGSTQYGTTADTVLGLDVVLADGSILTTGSAGGTHTNSPYFRNFGPDLTGLFLADTGALGFKTKAYLKLIPFPQHTRYATISFEHQAPAVQACSDIGRACVAAECYLWDPFFGRMVGENQKIGDQLKYVSGVVKSGSNLFAGLGDAVRLAISGKSAFAGTGYLLHLTFDDVSEGGAEGRYKAALAIGAKHGGKAIEPAAPRALRGRPFNDFAPIAQETPTKRNLPTHGIFPHSKLQQVVKEVGAYFEGNAALMAQHEITSGTIVFAIGANAVCVEPLMYWTDEQLGLHNKLTEKADVAALAQIKERPAATHAVAQLRKGLVEIFSRNGASHAQIGKSYPYKQTRQPEAWRLLEQIKAAVDPKGLVNPGSLGLSPPG
jgi:FAD/FMN-containing dehydrogenase